MPSGVLRTLPKSKTARSSTESELLSDEVMVGVATVKLEPTRTTDAALNSKPAGNWSVMVKSLVPSGSVVMISKVTTSPIDTSVTVMSCSATPDSGRSVVATSLPLDGGEVVTLSLAVAS